MVNENISSYTLPRIEYIKFLRRSFLQSVAIENSDVENSSLPSNDRKSFNDL